MVAVQPLLSGRDLAFILVTAHKSTPPAAADHSNGAAKAAVDVS